MLFPRPERRPILIGVMTPIGEHLFIERFIVSADDIGRGYQFGLLGIESGKPLTIVVTTW